MTTTQTSNEKQIRDLIERWVAAIRDGDLEAVVADHADDIVMFDVPPPDDGVRGMKAYRETWPGFFEYIRHGAAFEINELTVVDGADVAFAYALMTCGIPGEMGQTRLRLTLGLRREGDRWIVLHEHHSFPDDSLNAQDDIRAIHDGWAEATETKNLDGMMASIADDIVSYEHQEPLEYVGIDTVRESCREGLEYGSGRTTFTVPNLTVRVNGDLAVAWGLNRLTSEDADGTEQEMWSRGTRVFERRGGTWLMTHQHVSFPTPDGEPLR